MIDQNIQKVSEAFHKHANHAAMIDFVSGILTPKEITEISTRIEIVKLLKAGVSQREIAEQLGVGVATVTRGSKELKIGRFKHV